MIDIWERIREDHLKLYFFQLVILFQIGIKFDGQKKYTAEYKMETYLKIARLYLEDDDPVEAETYINRSGLLQNEVKNEKLHILFKVCYARVQDYRRKFVG